MKRAHHIAVLPLLSLSAAAYSGATAAETPMPLTSTAFQDGEKILAKHTCDGEDLSVPLNWSGLPSRTKSVALIVDDPDAPDPTAPKMTWVHWVVYNIPPSVTALPEGAIVSRFAPQAREGANDWKQTHYRGPCPPIGTHRYFHKLYALDVVLPELDGHERRAGAIGHVPAERSGVEQGGGVHRGEKGALVRNDGRKSVEQSLAQRRWFEHARAPPGDATDARVRHDVDGGTAWRP